MDSQLVELGIREFAGLAGMDESRMEQYQDSYRKCHQLKEYVFFYVEMTTTYPKEFLDTDRWVFFLEDGQRTQVEPVRIVTHSIQKEPPWRVEGNFADVSSFSTMSRRLELYFVRGGMTEDLKGMKFVMLEERNPEVRAEGKWERVRIK